MVTVSPLHHQRWLKSKREELKKTFNKTKAIAFRKSALASNDLEQYPKKKWTPTIKKYAATIENSRVLLYQNKGFPKTLLLVYGVLNDKTVLVGFFSPIGDPFLECIISVKNIEWRPLLISKKSLMDNRKNYLNKLSLPMKQQAGLVKSAKKSKVRKKIKKR